MSEYDEHRINMLRKQCSWQRARGTSRDNGYPYHKHAPDCEICMAADAIEALQAQVKELEDLLRVAKCPNCSGDGVIAHGPDSRGDYDLEQCQWCDERAALQENEL